MGGYSVHCDDGSRMLLAFVGIMCCGFSVDETCRKGRK
jgi:hypothetical protein